jgi:tetratricopeptide (TPR) repeat protein
MAKQLGSADLNAYCGFAKTFDHLMQMGCSDALAVGREATEQLRRVGNLWDMVSTLALVHSSLRAMARYEEAAEVEVEAAPLAMRLGSVTAMSLLNHALSPLGMTTPEQIESYRQQVSAQIERYAKAGSAAVAAPNTRLGLALFWQGEWEEALGPFKRAAEGADVRSSIKGWDTFLPLCQAYAGLTHEAMTHLDQHRDQFAQLGGANSQGAWAWTLAAVEAFAVAGAKDRAASLYPMTLEALATGTVGRFYDFRLLETIAGIAAASGEKWAEAEGHFQRALEIVDGLPHPIEQGDARRFYARMLLDRGGAADRQQASELLSEAIERYRHMRMPRHIAMAESMLAEAASPANADTIRKT